MTTQLGTDLRSMALNLIATVGQNVTFKVPGTQTYDPMTRVFSEGVITDVPGTITPFLTDLERWAGTLGPLIEQVDAVCYVAASSLTFVPDQATRIVDGSGRTWKIIQVTRLSGDERPAAYELFVAR